MSDRSEDAADPPSGKHPPVSAGERSSARIVRHVEERILSGELPDGAALPAERDLMAAFGTSRSVVREAIGALGHRGLIEHRPRFRPIVRKPGVESALSAIGGIVGHLLGKPQGVRNLYETRLFLERALVREAALDGRERDLEELHAALADNHASIDESEAFYRTDTAFHGVLYRIPRNPVFPALHEAYTTWLAPHWSRMPRSPERNAMNYRSHAEIVARIVERDADGAELALRRHLDAAWEYVRVTFDQAPPDASGEGTRP